MEAHSAGAAGVGSPERGAGFYRAWGKRLLDLFLVFLGAPFVVIPAALTAICVVAFSGRPALFRQTRVGKHGKHFEILKFRTMRTPGCGTGSTVTVAGDERMTTVGRFLRKWKLDELPQLWNVLRGDMSFVGPRPDVPGYADRLEGDSRIILDVLPGITCPATLAFRDEEQLLATADDPERYNAEVVFPAKVALNKKYVLELSLPVDLRVLASTLRSVARRTRESLR